MPLFHRPGLGGPRIGRPGRPGLLGLAARTAVVAGTARAVSGGIRRRAGERAEADAHEAAPAAAVASSADHRIEQLQQLAALRDQGVLTDAELASQKSAILAGG
jgi:hypothetical protein